MKLKVLYENGEEGCVDITKVELGDDFEVPKEGNKVSCKVNVGHTMERLCLKFLPKSLHQVLNWYVCYNATETLN